MNIINQLINQLINRNTTVVVTPVAETVAVTTKPAVTRVKEVEVGAEIIGITGGSKRNPTTARVLVSGITFNRVPVRGITFSQILKADAEAFVTVYCKEMYANKPSVAITLGEFMQWTRPCENGRWA